MNIQLPHNPLHRTTRANKDSVSTARTESFHPDQDAAISRPLKSLPVRICTISRKESAYAKSDGFAPARSEDIRLQ